MARRESDSRRAPLPPLLTPGIPSHLTLITGEDADEGLHHIDDPKNGRLRTHMKLQHPTLS